MVSILPAMVEVLTSGEIANQEVETYKSRRPRRTSVPKPRRQRNCDMQADWLSSQVGWASKPTGPQPEDGGEARQRSLNGRARPGSAGQSMDWQGLRPTKDRSRPWGKVPCVVECRGGPLEEQRAFVQTGW